MTATARELPLQRQLLPSTVPQLNEVTRQTSEAIPLASNTPILIKQSVDKNAFHPIHPAETVVGDLDDQIGDSIKRGIDFLLGQFVDGQFKEYKKNDDESAASDALAVYALLQAAEATHDTRLSESSALVDQMLNALKAMHIEPDAATNGRSFRVAALSVYHRAQDKSALRADVDALMKQFSSKTQFDALGAQAAMEAGVDTPRWFWSAVQQHWLSCQLPDGEWSYGGYGDIGRLSMTVAGITNLLVAGDELNAKGATNTLGRPPFAPPLARALKWLEASDNSVSLPAEHYAYNLFELERAALASGLKYFGTHNWYRDLATQQLHLQKTDGSWPQEQPINDTAYTLLFLSRGRYPIFMNKLRFDGHWSNRPRDIYNLTRYAVASLERPLNWQVVSLKSDWTEWMDSPVLYIASHEPLEFTDQQVDNLRSFAENGGLVFTHADGDNGAFNRSITQLCHRLFPQYALGDLPATSPVYSVVYPIKPAIKLQGLSNGSRLLLIHSPTDLSKTWQQRDTTAHPTPFEMGVNIFVYAAGKEALRNKLKTTVISEPSATPIATTTIAQLRHLGDYNPEPAGLPRFARLFESQTGIKVNIQEVDPSELKTGKFSVVHLTGTGVLHLLPAELRAVHDYVDSGGTLLIDACGGSDEFNKSILANFLPSAFAHQVLVDMQNDNPILTGTGSGMVPVTLRLRLYQIEVAGITIKPIQQLTQGKGLVIYSSIDLSSALLGTNTWDIKGYQPETAYDLVHNVLLSALNRQPSRF